VHRTSMEAIGVARLILLCLPFVVVVSGGDGWWCTGSLVSLYASPSSRCGHLCLDADSDTLLASDFRLNAIHVMPLSGTVDGGGPQPTTRVALPDKSLSLPNGIAISPEGVLFVADSGDRRIVSITVPLL
jgi:hypothetical protein